MDDDELIARIASGRAADGGDMALSVDLAGPPASR